jgi:hypothetical protein
VLERDGCTGARLTLLSYCAASPFERYAGEHSNAIAWAAVSATLKDRFDDKIQVRTALAARGLPVPDFLVLDGSMHDYHTLAARLGARVVVQRRIGAAGSGTYEISCERDLESVKRLACGAELLASRYAGDTTVNVHGLVLPDGVESSTPSVQLTGIPELTPTRHAYCGNDFSAVRELAPSIVATCRALTRSVGRWLQAEGYRGLFGVDLVADGRTVSILEVNPRMQGSTWLLGELEARSGVVPMVVRHFQLWMDEDVPASPTDVRLPPSGAHGMLHLVSGGARRVSHRLRCGIYQLHRGGRLRDRVDPRWPLALASNEVFLCGLPLSGSVVEAGAVVARFACDGGLSRCDGRALTARGQAIVRAIEQELTLDHA